jgi:alpha-N-arabinofuranosidase
MTRCTAISCLLTACLASSSALAEDVSLTVHPDRVLNRIDEKVYGHFLEHIYHSCNGGLWGELIWDRSFEGGGAGVAWQRRDGCIEQQGAAADVRLVFGEPTWTDYEFSVEARKTGGNEGFLIILRALNKREFYWANLGGWSNIGHALERGIQRQDRWATVTPRRNGRIETDRWYRIRARCEGPRIQVWLDGDLTIDYTDDGRGTLRGRAGVGTWATQAQFRNFKVASLDGKTLHEGLPPLPAAQRSVVPSWQAFGDLSGESASGHVSTSTENPLNGIQCKRIQSEVGCDGISQGPICIRAGEVYRGSLWARGNAHRLCIELMDGETRLGGRDVHPVEEWKEFPFEFKPVASSDTATLRIGTACAADVWIDQVSLMPESWREAGGFRPDLLQAIADLKPPVIRWPGGCFASPYRWKDGIGPQHRRGPHPKSMWDDKEVNSFGTDEFIAMCRRVGAEPLIVVNIGTPEWNRDCLDNDFLQEALDWIEYCNGPVDSRWGKIRAANGHPEPYNVKYWEIDNETWHMGAETYVEWVNRFAPAMRKADPSIKLAACGSAGHGDGGNGLAWNRVLIDGCADKIDYLSIHHYANPNLFASDPLAYEAFFRKTGDLIKASKNPNLKIYVSEWNAQSTDWRTGLYCGGLLNAFERCGDVLEIGGPALFLRHVSASAWDNAFVNFDQRTWFPAPNYVVMKLWHDCFCPYRIDLQGGVGGLNIVATKSEDGKTIRIKAVNPTEETVNIRADLTGSAVGQATMQLVAPGSLQARNTLEEPHAVKPVSGRVSGDEDRVRFELPPLSAGVVTIQLTTAN